MSNLIGIVEKFFSRIGYVKHRSLRDQQIFRNFLNLAGAYEARLIETVPELFHNEVRLKLLSRMLGTAPSEAFFIVKSLAETKGVEGDICEFGVAQGETSALIANELLQIPGKVLHLFDSFEGLPEPTEKDLLKDDIFSLGSMQAYKGTMACSEEMVRARFGEIGFPVCRLVLHKGFIEDLPSDDPSLPEKVSFAYVDFDLYEPISVALKMLHRKTSAGSIVIVDDYDFFSTGAKTAVDEFVTSKNINETIYDCYVPETVFGHFAVLTKRGK